MDKSQQNIHFIKMISENFMATTLEKQDSCQNNARNTQKKIIQGKL
jgi:hypothetical protein